MVTTAKSPRPTRMWYPTNSLRVEANDSSFGSIEFTAKLQRGKVKIFQSFIKHALLAVNHIVTRLLLTWTDRSLTEYYFPRPFIIHKGNKSPTIRDHITHI